MKYLFLVFCSCLFCSVNGQKTSLNCGLLQAAIETNVFQQRFNVCKSNEEIHVVDKSKSFANCILEDVCKKRLSVHSDSSGIEEGDIIEIYRIDMKKNVFTLYFHRPATGATLILRIKYKKRKTKLLGYEVGAF